jgi:hypothetical protein
MLNQGTARLSEWLTKIESGVEPQPLGNLLLGLGEGAAGYAREKESLEWAIVATRAYQLESSPGTPERESATLKAMHLRAWFISKVSTTPGNPILDKEIILEWFERRLKYSFEEVLQKIAKWEQTTQPLDQRLPLSEVLELRGIKSRLSPIRILSECNEIPSNSELHRWLEIQRRLP